MVDEHAPDEGESGASDDVAGSDADHTTADASARVPEAEVTAVATAVDPAELARLREQIATLQDENQHLQHDLEAKKRPKARKWGAIALIVIGSLLLPIAVGTVWLRQTVLSTDDYVETVGPLASDPDIQAAASARVADEVVTAIDLKGLAEEALPEDAKLLAVPIASGGQFLIEEVAAEVVATDVFRDLWEEANRLSHSAVLEILSGRDDAVLQTSEGQITLDLGGVADEVAAQAEERLGLDLSELLPEDGFETQFVLAESEELADAQGAVDLIDRLAWLNVILALGFLVGGLFLAPVRSRGIFWVGIGVTVSMLLALLGYAWARDTYEDGVASAVASPDAAMALFDILTRFLLRSMRTMFVLGIVLTVIGWYAGPSDSAGRARAGVDRLLGRSSSDLEGRMSLGPVPSWVASHRTGLRVTVVGLAALALVAWDKPTGFVILLLLVLAVIGLGIVEVLARMGEAEVDQPLESAPAASGTDTA